MMRSRSTLFALCATLLALSMIYGPSSSSQPRSSGMKRVKRDLSHLTTSWTGNETPAIPAHRGLASTHETFANWRASGGFSRLPALDEELQTWKPHVDTLAVTSKHASGGAYHPSNVRKLVLHAGVHETNKLDLTISPPSPALGSVRGELGTLEVDSQLMPYVVQVSPPLTAEDREALESILGAPLGQYLPHNSWIVLTTESRAGLVSASVAAARERGDEPSPGDVVWIGELSPEWKMTKSVWALEDALEVVGWPLPEQATLEQWVEEGRAVDEERYFAAKTLLGVEGSIVMDLVRHVDGVHPTRTLADVTEMVTKEWAPELEWEHVEFSVTPSRVFVTGVALDHIPAVAVWFASKPSVASVEVYSQPKQANRWSKFPMLNSEIPPIGGRGEPTEPPEITTPYYPYGIKGKDQVVGVGDSGLFMTHCAFQDQDGEAIGDAHRKVMKYVSFGDDTDADGHGTHVCGTIAGEAKEGDSQTGEDVAFNGVAPDAKLVVYDIGVGCCTGALQTPPALVTEDDDEDGFFSSAYLLGGRIHSNSWGQDDTSYNFRSAEVDTFVYDHPDMVILFAAGNDGDASGSISVGAPATAKNGLAIGSGHNLFEGFKDACEYKLCYPSANNAVLDADPEIFDYDNVATTSSRGPTTDLRVKPDIIAPGHVITSAESDTGCTFTTFSGTSMATPNVAGTVALLRQYLASGYNTAAGRVPEPPAALIRAMLINSGRPMAGTVDGAPLPANPFNEYTGFGRMVLQDVAYMPFNDFGSELIFDGSSHDVELTEVEESREFCVRVDDSRPFSVTLVWDDFPAANGAATAIINDLDLVVTGPDDTVYVGNAQWQFFGAGEADRVNTVEKVYVEAPESGKWCWTVTAAVIQEGPVKFATVASGGGKSIGRALWPVITLWSVGTVATVAIGYKTHGALKRRGWIGGGDGDWEPAAAASPVKGSKRTPAPAAPGGGSKRVRAVTAPNMGAAAPPQGGSKRVRAATGGSPTKMRGGSPVKGRGSPVKGRGASPQKTRMTAMTGMTRGGVGYSDIEGVGQINYYE